MNKIISIKTVVCVFLMLGFVTGQSGTQHYFEQGNNAYRENNYLEALEWYHKIEEAGFESGHVYYNIGNCYYKLDQIGHAVLYYEKALKLKPDDKEIQFNLELANLKVVDRLEMPPQFFLFEWWDNLKVFFSIYDLTIVVVILYVISIALLIALLFLRYSIRRKTILTLLGVSAVLTIFFTYLLILNVQESSQNRHAIILTQSANVLSAPNEGSTDVFVLHEGAKVSLDEQRGEWVKISLPDGKTGWLQQDYLGII